MKKIFSFLLILIATFAINGCDDKKIYNAKVIDSEVEGIEYQCAGLVKYTNKSGSVNCYHLPLGFKVGEIKIGIMYELPKDHIILPQDMLNIDRKDFNNENLKKLTILLQSIDIDSNPENGITISKDISKKLDDFIDLKKISLEELKDYLEAKLNRKLISPSSAISHLQRSMKKYNIKE